MGKFSYGNKKRYLEITNTTTNETTKLEVNTIGFGFLARLKDLGGRITELEESKNWDAVMDLVVEQLDLIFVDDWTEQFFDLPVDQLKGLIQAAIQTGMQADTLPAKKKRASRQRKKSIA